MSATVTVSVRIPLEQHRAIKRAAKAAGLKIATFVREGAFLYATLRIQPPARVVNGEEQPASPGWSLRA